MHSGISEKEIYLPLYVVLHLWWGDVPYCRQLSGVEEKNFTLSDNQK